MKKQAERRIFMLDSLHREVNYLRVSVTQRCNLNCLYCGSAAPESRELSAAEIDTIVSVCAKLGIKKVRLTGGEPLLRRDITDIAARIHTIKGVGYLAMTTNGTLLAGYASDLKKAGLNAVNISLDTLDAAQYRRMTGADALQNVLAGVDAALSAGFEHVRINSVLMRGENETAADQLIAFAKHRTVDVRFIELMPFADPARNGEKIIKAKELLARFPFQAAENDAEDGVANYYTLPGFKGRIGFITPLSNQFCDKCNRIRLLSDGKLRPCLGHEATYDLLPVLDDPMQLENAIRRAILSKPAGHTFACASENLYAMNKIGG